MQLNRGSIPKNQHSNIESGKINIKNIYIYMNMLSDNLKSD